MRDCVLSVYSDEGFLLTEEEVVVPVLPPQWALDSIGRSVLESLDPEPAYAVVREGLRPRAVWIARRHLPDAAIQFAGRRSSSGRWLTSAVPLEGQLRAWVGPEVFLRQLDLGGRFAWLVTVLYAMDVDVRTRVHSVEPPVTEWKYADQRWLCSGRPGRWRLWGAGRTADERLEPVQAAATTAAELLWGIGAVPLR